MRIAATLTTALIMGLAAGQALASPRTPPAAQPQSGQVSVPAGTRVLVRMKDSLDTSSNKTGDRFTATLETDLLAGNTVAVRRGATVYGRLAKANSAGRYKGSSELSLELTDIVIGGKTYPLLTNTYDVKGKGEGGETTKKVLGGAGLGALIGGIAGGGTGAAIGAVSGAAVGTGVAASKKGQQLSVPSETLLEFRLQQPASLPAR
ncbi:MAG TPA: hypothetical protein VL099_08940 [Candidatus Binatia bacterium]|nr:hypothetical protein [Candidatus Binatia bacterium]